MSKFDPFKTTPSPAPWYVDEENDVRDANDQIVALSPPADYPMEVSTLNSRLMASAPDLLSACRAVCKEITHPVILQVLEAVRKAEEGE